MDSIPTPPAFPLSEPQGDTHDNSANLYPLAIDVIRAAISRYPACRTLYELFGKLHQSIGFLQPFAQMAILLRQPDACFELFYCSNAAARESMTALSDRLIETGHFAQALQQRGCLAVEFADHTGFMHALATPNRVSGMVLLDRTIPASLHQPFAALVDLAAVNLDNLHNGAATFLAPHYRLQYRDTDARVYDDRVIPADQLTGLAQRAQFIRFLQRAFLEQASRSGIGILLLDIDRFHHINREFGSETGDRVLRDVALRLDSALRSRHVCAVLGIAERDLCFARTGADEFGLALSHMRYPGRLAEIATYLHSHLAEGFRQEGFRLYPSVSIGVASSHSQAEPISAQAMLRSADTALKRAKTVGRNRHVVYESAWDTAGSPSLRTESLLQEALREDRFQLHFQPLFRLDDQALVGAEVLLRLQKEDGIPVSPAEFIPIAENTGQIVEIGEWVWRRVCRQIQVWDAAGFPRIPLSINVSAIELSSGDLAAKLALILRQEGIRPERLHIEITETAVACNEEQALASLRALRSAGFEIWIDDFGIGYSSLRSVKNYPISGLKLDREFVKDLALDPAAEVIAGTILTMARQLNHSVIAEGIENEAQFQLLKQHGCTSGQGYHLGHPVLAETFQARYFVPEDGRSRP
ncbi:putative bifunctional diguanylate cyclase/phosphodiesterase [Thiocystis violascens]|uniref:Diguanylate cyclase (GGDEF) domain-containing protein n=1 Tax=Thiocystis violascens (strain ATCC 17096 / DSM 198 / 6111) TaxID=765911 RepID=I3YG47_THIV6|nr:bifunctional diguanylate cyclase/phosphodiesterase [Thiocystis violascens]AFL75965.1 diguanylate cyclase (GGDEF) domain-containing protein [Thiocystis violascens DSM 198]